MVEPTVWTFSYGSFIDLYVLAEHLHCCPSIGRGTDIVG